tara:strand:- start:3719 stop:4042 length:324 start_codon:yes stop_codon:yes gene_type:complete
METIMTVLSTVGVGALAYAVAAVIRLSRRVVDLELVRTEMNDIHNDANKQIEYESRDRCTGDQEIHNRIDEYQVQLESSTDRRFDNVWEVVHKLDKTINPNTDILKK